MKFYQFPKSLHFSHCSNGKVACTTQFYIMCVCVCVCVWHLQQTPQVSPFFVCIVQVKALEALNKKVIKNKKKKKRLKNPRKKKWSPFSWSHYKLKYSWRYAIGFNIRMYTIEKVIKQFNFKTLIFSKIYTLLFG